MIKSNLYYKLYIASSALLINALFAAQFQPERNLGQTLVLDSSRLQDSFPSALVTRDYGPSEGKFFRTKPMGLEEILRAEKIPLFLEESRNRASMNLLQEDIVILTGDNTSHLQNFNRGFFEGENTGAPPFYIGGGDDFLPFGKFQSAMITQPLTQKLGRTKSTPVIVGYRSPEPTGFFGEVFTYRSNLGEQSGVLGAQARYVLKDENLSADIGTSYIGSIADSVGMQDTGAAPGKTFGGFGSMLHGNQDIKPVSGISFHGNFKLNRYKLIVEYLTATTAFRESDLSFNGRGAKPKAAQLEAGVDFVAFDKPASLSLGYQWSDETLALNIPHHRIASIFNISLWENTIESLEFRHDMDFAANQFANGIAPVGQMNQTKVASGRGSDTVVAQVKFNF